MRTGDLSLGRLQDAAQAVGAGWQVHGTGGKAPLWDQTEAWLEVIPPIGSCPVLHVLRVGERFLWCVSWTVPDIIAGCQLVAGSSPSPTWGNPGRV